QGKMNYEDYQHEIWCLKISDNPAVDEDEPNVFFGSSIHARETISLEVDMHIIYYLVENYGVNDSVTFWIDNTQIWFIPLINPDGHKLVIEQLYTSHRKNMRDNNNNNIPDYSTVDGVDLNRNFDFHWDGPYSSSSTTSESYRGTAPWSEPETQYLRDLLQAHKFYAGITYHSYGQVVLYPPGHQPSAMGYDHAAMSDLATEMAATIPNIDNNGYYSPQSANTYLASGSMGDWGYGVERIFSFTIELSKAPYFHPPASWIQPICEANLEAALIMIDRVHKAVVTGNITDTAGNPLVAEVYVDEIDYQPGMSEVDPVRSGNTFGRYYRVLLPGTYNLSFVSEEFGQIEIPDVTVSSDSITQLNVVFGFEFADSLSIEIIDDQIILDWLSEPGYSYEVMSSSNPYNDFEVDETGFYVDENSWQSEITEERRFFRVRRQ
ncbi:MAG: hypothetical protein JW996_07175, partial [Candidatus Cloacimonetes bacterium]|nr:hypothetical protein [Candidatus Cloacimonadota bacterium]